MALVTPSELATNLGVGTLYSDATLQEICDAADAVLLPMLWTNNYYAVAHGNTGTVGTLYFDQLVSNIFYIGESVTITNSGTKYNGSKTITGVGEYSITLTTTHTSDTPKHPIEPYGVVSAESYVDWADDDAVQLAALMIASDIFQAKQAPAGGVSIDGITPSPWKMSASLLAKVRGLIAHALSPNSMVG